MKKSLYHLLMLCAVTTLLSSCMFGGKAKIEYLPYQEEKGGDWGLISVNGEVLYKEQFSKCPTAVVNNRFTVENEEGLYELYEPTKKKPTRVNKTDYKAIGFFLSDITPAVEPGKPIDVIDKDGNVKFTFAEADGKPVRGMSVYINGYAIFQAGDLFGLVDTDGEVVIPAEYSGLSQVSDGKLVGVKKNKKKTKSEKASDDDSSEEDKTMVYILDASGKELGSFKSAKVPRYSGVFYDGVMAAATNKNDETAYGLMNEKGEWELEPSTKIKSLHNTFEGDVKPNTSTRNGLYVFEDKDNEYGLIDKEGEVVLRAKYKSLYFIDDELLAAKKKKSNKYVVIDIEGNEVFDDEFDEISPFYEGSDYCFAKVDKGEYTLINRKGEKMKKSPDIYNIRVNEGSYWVESDYVDFDALVNEMKLKEDGFLDFTLTQKPLDALHNKQALEDLEYAAEPDPSDFRWSISFYGSTTLQGNIYASYTIGYDSTIAEDIKERVTENYYGYSYSWDKTVGQRFKEIYPEQIVLTVNNSGKMNGKMKDLFTAILPKVKKFGTEAKSNKNACVINIDGATGVAVFNAGSEVRVVYFRGDAQDVSIDDYENVSEDTNTKSDDFYDYEEAEVELADSAAVPEE